MTNDLITGYTDFTPEELTWVYEENLLKIIRIFCTETAELTEFERVQVEENQRKITSAMHVAINNSSDAEKIIMDYGFGLATPKGKKLDNITKDEYRILYMHFRKNFVGAGRHETEQKTMLLAPPKNK